jgi:hypothetical protein
MKNRLNLIIKTVCVFTLFLTSTFSFSQRLFQSEAAKEDSKLMASIEVELPTPFNKKELHPFSPFAYSSLKFFIDKSSISYINDEEVRLTVVTLNEGEKYQGIYIGFRCNEYEYRQYGFLDDGVWRRPQDVSWRPIPRLGYNQYVTFLAKASTCQGGAVTLNKTALIEGLNGPKNSFD